MEALHIKSSHQTMSLQVQRQGLTSVGQTFQNIGNVDGDDETYAENTLVGGQKIAQAITVHDIGSTQLFKTIKTKAILLGPGNGRIRKISYSNDNINYTVVDIEDIILHYDKDGLEAWKEIVLESAVNARYVAVEWYFTSQSGNTSYLRVYTVQIGINTYISSAFYSSQKNISDPPSYAKLYMSVETPATSSVVPMLSANGGTNYESLNILSSRADPLDPTFTEKEYEVTFINTGSNLILKTTLNPKTGGKETPHIKRYGLHWA